MAGRCQPWWTGYAPPPTRLWFQVTTVQEEQGGIGHSEQGPQKSSHFQKWVHRSGIASCFAMEGYLPKILLSSFHKIKGILTPEKQVGHKIEDRTPLYIEQILFYERLATLSFASTFHPKLVKTLSWTSLGDHCIAKVQERGFWVGRGQVDPQGRSSPWFHSCRSFL